MWRVWVELEEPTTMATNPTTTDPKRRNPTTTDPKTMDLEEEKPKRKLLNVLIGQGQNSVNFQLPRSHATDRSKKIRFDPALSRSVNICPGQKEINENSTLRIRLASEDQEILVKVFVNVVEKGDGWKLIDIGNDEKGMQIESQFVFSNPLIRTVRFDKIDLGRDHYVNLRIESEENSPCFCSLLSVQKAQCPYYDTIADAKRFGRWQTMINSTAMVIDINEFADEKNELLIVLIGAEPSVCNYVSKDTKEECAGKEAIGGSLRKNVTITLEPTARDGDRWQATSIIAIGYLAITTACFIVSGVLFKFDNKDRLVSLRQSQREQRGENVIGTEGEEKALEEEDPVAETEQATVEAAKPPKKKITFQDIVEKVVGWEEKTSEVNDIEDREPRCCGRRQRTMSMEGRKTLDKRTSQLCAVGKSRARYQKNQLFIGVLFIISIFYATTVLHYRPPSLPNKRNTRQGTMTSATTTPDARFLFTTTLLFLATFLTLTTSSATLAMSFSASPS